MRIYLVRHCDALHPVVASERPLSDRGRDQARRLAVWMSRHVAAVDEIRHSGVVRARETAEILATAIRPEPVVRAVPGWTPADSARSAAESLHHETGTIVVVTHLPIVAHVAALLLGGRFNAEPLAFHTGSAAALSGEGASWQLDWLVHPGLLPAAPPREPE